MPTKATLRYVRIAPRKVRLVADLLKGKKVSDAQTLLEFVHNTAVESFQKLIRSASSNAARNSQVDEANLYISKIVVNEGPKLKRFRPRARGQAYPIQKKTSHITIVLEELASSTGEYIQTTARLRPSTSSGLRRGEGGEKPKFVHEKKMRSQKLEGVRSRIFRRKAI